VIPLLRRAGHTVIALDLPAHGIDRTPTRAVTLQGYTDQVCAALDAQSEPVILVGHSMGGLVISQAAEQRPDQVAKLVYLTAFLLRDRQTLLDIAQEDPEALVLPNLEFSGDQTSAVVRDDVLPEVFYGDCAEEDVALARALLVPQAGAPFGTPIHVTEENWGRVPRFYIECLQDRAISIASQRGMVERSPCQRVITMDTSHSPFFSAPVELANHLLSAGLP
jgi:pimeloyl-ACP methyl ester carboxylesterase